MGLDCQILLTPPTDGIYRSGQSVTGTLKINKNDTAIIEKINIHFSGKLKGKHNTFESDYDRISKEQFVLLSHNVAETLEEKDKIKKGIYDHPFEFQLPEDLPSSYRDKSCIISYKVIVELTVAGLFNSKRIETEVPVYGKVKRCSAQPQTYGLTKNPFPSNDPIDLHIEIKNTFLSAGDNIELSYLINNEAKIPVTGIKTKLILETAYKYDDKHKKVQRKDLSSVESPGAKEHSETKINCILPTLPDLFTIQHSKFFRKDYKVIVTATFPFPHRDASVEIPVVIQMGNTLPQMEVNGTHNALGFLPYLNAVLRPFV